MENVKHQQINSEKVVESVSKPFGFGRMRHKLHDIYNKGISGLKPFIKTDPINQMWQTVTSKVRDIAKTVRVTGKDTVKVKSVMSPRFVEAMSLFNKYKGRIPMMKAGVFLGGAFVLTMFARHALAGLFQSNQGSAYIPEKYSRGYDTIKENMTDFGSKVYLSKTAAKMNVTPRNTTRDGFIRTTSTITKSNLSFRLHSNAINHTRY